jgi:CO/xanthine dehydrogenase FAD-binding subunit
MKPARFHYLRPATLEEALAAKRQHGDDARFLAGGQSLVPAMNFRMAQPLILIDLNGISELATVEQSAGRVSIGAMMRYGRLERHAGLLAALPILRDTLPVIAHPQIRSRGTIGGNVCHADPASEMPAVLLALGARMVVVSAVGRRDVPVNSFFAGPLTTTLEADELLSAIAIDLPPEGTGMSFLELARRRGDFAIAGVAAVMTVSDGKCADLKVALCGVADHAFLTSAVDAIMGRPPDDAALDDLAAAIAAPLTPPGSLHASAAYQKHVTQALCERALRTARDRAVSREAA